VLDEGGGFSGPVDIEVRGDKVGRVGAGLRSSLPSYDFSGLFAMPGMVDCHLHAIATSLDTIELLRMPLSQRVLEAASMLRRTLQAGVTAARDASGIDAGIRNGVAQGFVPGPDLQIALAALTETGGHYDGYLHGLGVPMTTGYQVPDYPGRPNHVVDGPDEIRKAVRSMIRAGVDWIKLCTTGGIVSGTGGASQFTREEIFTAVAEARRRGKPAMVHCYGGEGLRNSVEAGVRSIDHGVFMTEEDAELMKAHHCWLVPTVTIQQDIKEWAEAGKLGPAAASKVKEIEPYFGRSVRIARAAGVKIALGTDFISREQHGTNLREIAAVVDAGLSLEEALLAATRNGAELLGLDKDHGRIAEGFFFDAIVVGEDPSDLKFARTGAVEAVFKHGKPVKSYDRMATSASGEARTPVGVER
jgi:imidazolonepropionase-like amidohydrolase